MMPHLFISADDLFAERRQAIPLPAVPLAGVGVRQLAVAVVRERHVAAAAHVELLHPVDRGAFVTQRVTVLDPDQRDLLALRIDPPHVLSRERQLDLIGRQHFRQAMNRFELLDRLPICVGVTLRSELTLPDINDEEGSVETALLHLRQVDLVAEVLRVVVGKSEVAWIDVVVRVEGDHPIVDGFRLRHQRRVSGRGCRLGRLRTCENTAERDRNRAHEHGTSHRNSLNARHSISRTPSG